MDKIESAIKSLLKEYGLQHIKSSLQMEYADLKKAHDAIHEFMALAPLCFPDVDENEISWKNRSAFLLYHWEVFNHAHRSFFEALCTYYNVAFILLRTTLELLIKGVFWECMSHKKFRDNTPILDNIAEFKKIKNFIEKTLDSSPKIENKLEQFSAIIFDIVEPFTKDKKFRLPTFRKIVCQLDEWGIFSPIPDVDNVVYNRLYSYLSSDIHVTPDRTDIGRRISSEKQDLFEQDIIQEVLHDYAVNLHEIIDIAIVIELNILQDIIERYEPVCLKLSKRLHIIEDLNLKYSIQKIRGLCK